MKRLVKVLAGLLVGAVVAPLVGIDALRYLSAVGLTLAIGLPIGILVCLVMILRAGSDVELDVLMSSVGVGVMLLVDQRLGFTLSQIVTLALVSVVVRFCAELLLPTYKTARG